MRSVEIDKEDIQGAFEVYPDVDPLLTHTKEQQLILFKEAIGMIAQFPNQAGQTLTQEQIIDTIAPMMPSINLNKLKASPVERNKSSITTDEAGLEGMLGSDVMAMLQGQGQVQQTQAPEYNVGGGGMGGNIANIL